MKITRVVSYDAMFRADLTDDPELEASKTQLLKDFKAYLQRGQHLYTKPTGIFGRDELYDHLDTPSSVKAAKLRHVHVLPLSALSVRYKGFKYRQTSDVHLVYCIDELKGHACVIALLKPGHAMARNALFLSRLAEIAEQFFNR
ncbi:hypothetical protein KAM448_43710 [Aeromonas caviae]|uniref:mRNA interferase YafO n=1 Tax=Aeromonas caviae TaxID=648 RepID=A0ABD0BDE6_AERCA|nr:type II toxin-antitoxin system YafO family toxin [Aeromonas caviae]MBL0648948.1 type II toxin-antitoxin system YafO family toxin [Aeromonas caviae]MDX7854332.1 type II toxin-antitoxin system YafO family toxin [Aeromonas caviae]MDX7892673.1 type II toxin-antitoxin system YafO family toxin [Aeromonas caviae]GJA83804.1 hypothetical protein KAM355_43640 [Aeromonas caviae]GJB13872.1 hypothetical protein KAM362_44320 [Aeromonas caviae]